MTCRELTTGDLLGLGLAPKTAYIYARIWAKVEEALAARGVDWLTCSSADVGVIASTWTASHSSRSQLRAAIGHAWDILERESPPSLRSVRVPPRPRLRCKAIEADAAGRLERAAWARQDLAGLAVLVGLYSALRRSEIACLRWDDFAFDDAGDFEWLTVKGKYGLVADIPVHPTLARILADWRRPTGWVFPGRTGTGGPVCPATIWLWVRTVGDDAGVPIRTHLLRHTALAEANDRSGDLRTVQDLARHSRPEITAGYTRTTSAKLKAVTAMIDYGRGAA